MVTQDNQANDIQIKQRSDGTLQHKFRGSPESLTLEGLATDTMHTCNLGMLLQQFIYLSHSQQSDKPLLSNYKQHITFRSSQLCRIFRGIVNCIAVLKNSITENSIFFLFYTIIHKKHNRNIFISKNRFDENNKPFSSKRSQRTHETMVTSEHLTKCTHSSNARRKKKRKRKKALVYASPVIRVEVA